MEKEYQRKLQVGIGATLLRSNKKYSEGDIEGAEIFYIVAKECYNLLEKSSLGLLETLNHLERKLNLPLTEK